MADRRRMERVNGLLREEIAGLLASQVNDPRLKGIITITQVRAASDLRSARVYVSVMGTEAVRQEALAGIQSSASYLRRELRSRVSLRHVPFLTFQLDDAMLEAACENSGEVKVLAVTALTSLDRRDLEDLGFQCSPRDLVLSRARRAFEIGCDGVISSGLEAAALRESVDSRLLVVTPGIRPVENRPPDDQKRTVSVREAFQNGADHIVVGRPVRDAPDPRASAEAIQGTIAEVFSGNAR